ncbi:MAG: beta-ketoacyl-[acyl-carrier-protein] synthase family protein [Actinomycetota bacterium]|nr:beta-ketoacyl-[acyl-carrier-protein] synthase family protein [Actinomycetota bacterium]
MENGYSGAYVTGIGLVTPIGVGRKEFWSALLGNKSGVGPITLFDPEGFEVRIAAECINFDPRSFMDRKVAQRMDRFAQMGLASAVLAIEDAAAQDFLQQNPERVGSVLGSGLGGVMSMERTKWEMKNKGVGRVSPFTTTKIMTNAAAAHVSLELGVQGPSITPALACSCGTEAMGIGLDLLRRGDADMVLCGASEAPITPTITAAFASMQAMSVRNDDPQGACRPYDKDHSGFVIAEGAAVMVLESAESVVRRGVEPYAKVTGVGRTTEAYSLTDPDPAGRGIRRAMTLAMESASLQPEQIGYINPHGSGTPAGDGPESWAVHSLNPKAKISATKSNLGDPVGATGAIESAICALSIKEQVVPPMRNLVDRAEDCAPLEYVVDEPVVVPGLEAAICANMGVGGHNAAITLERA